MRLPQGLVPGLVCDRVWTRGIPRSRGLRVLLGLADALVLVEQLPRRALDAKTECSYDLRLIGRRVSVTLHLLPVVAECLVLVEVQVASNEPARRRLVIHEADVEVLPGYAVQTTMVMP